MPVVNPMVFYWMSVADKLDDVLCFNHRFYHCPHALPDKQTIEKMVIAQNVTYERVEQATDVVSNVYNDIMDLFKEEKGDE